MLMSTTDITGSGIQNNLPPETYIIFSHARQCRSFSRNRFRHACILRPCTTTRRIDEKFSISSLASGELRSQTKTIYIMFCSEFHCIYMRPYPVGSIIQLIRLLVSARTYQPANSVFLSQQTSTSRAYQPRNQPANRLIVWSWKTRARHKPLRFFLHTRNNTFSTTCIGEWERSMHFYQDIYPIITIIQVPCRGCLIFLYFIYVLFGRAS